MIPAVYAAFFGSGFAFASFASRIPQVRDALDLGPAALGLVILAVAVGSMSAVPLAGIVVHRFGSSRSVGSGSVLSMAGLALAAVGILLGMGPVVVGLYVYGVGLSLWDVAMNVEGAEVERAAGRSIMSRFHAGFSLGTVAGAVAGIAMNAAGIPVTAHLLSVAIPLAMLMPMAARRFLPAGESDLGPDGARETSGPSPLRSWREPRTLLIGGFVLAMALSEGVANDWLAVAAVDGHAASAAMGSLALAILVASMTLVRWFGPALLDRYGRVPVLRASAVTAFAGVVIVIASPGLVAMYAGIVLWGAGVALGFPVGMSAAADDPARAAGRVSVVSTIGYCAFLAGPTLIGMLAERSGVLHALAVVAGSLAAGAILAGATRPLRA